MNASMSTIDTVLASNGLTNKDFADSKVIAIAIAVASSASMPPRILPESMQTISAASDIPAALQRFASDRGLVLSTLRAVALYIRAAFDGDTSKYSSADVQGFYDAYQTATDADKRIALVGTLRMFDDIMTEELMRVAPEAAGLLDQTGVNFDGFVQETADEPDAILLYNLEGAISFAVNLAQVILKEHEVKGQTITEAREEYRGIGQILGKMMDLMTSRIVGDVLKQSFKAKMSEEDFNTVEAILELQYGDNGERRPVH